MPDLRKGQYKRIGRIAETNPERAEKVANRMEKRASREERGKEVAIGTGIGTAKLYQANDEEKAKAVSRMTGRDYPLSPTPEPVNKKSWNEESPRRSEDPKDRVFMGARKVIK